MTLRMKEMEVTAKALAPVIAQFVESRTKPLERKIKQLETQVKALQVQVKSGAIER